MEKEKIISFNRSNVYSGMSPKGYGRTYFAKKDFAVGDLVMMGIGKIIDHQTPHLSVQIEKNKHYLPTKWTGKYWNHSCNPNTCAKTRKSGFPNLKALKKIKKGDEITYAYWMTEFAWIKNADENKVACKCGSKNCKRKVLSFSQLSESEQRNALNADICSDHLHRK